jgi:uncharacterized protein (TIGR02246 family)
MCNAIPGGKVKTLVRCVVFTCLVGMAFTFAQDTSTEIRNAIDTGNARYIEAFAKLDANGLAAVYDKDGARFGPKGSYARGREAIAKKINEFMQSVTGAIRVTIDTEDLWVVDDLAYETGKYTYTYRLVGKEESHIGGHYVTVWKKQSDGGWRITADMGVTND